MLGGGTEAGGFVESRQGVDLGNLLVILPAPPAEEIDGGIAGGGEEEGPGVSHATAGVGAEGSDISFLHEIVVVGQSGKPFREVSAQGRFVGLNLLGKPSGLISRGHGVKLTGNCGRENLKAGDGCRVRCGNLEAGGIFSKRD